MLRGGGGGEARVTRPLASAGAARTRQVHADLCSQPEPLLLNCLGAGGEVEGGWGVVKKEAYSLGK